MGHADLPKRTAAELARDLRARALLLTGEAWERDATRAMMYEAADLLTARDDAGARALETVSLEKAVVQATELERIKTRWHGASAASYGTPRDVSFQMALDDIATLIALAERDGAASGQVARALEAHQWQDIETAPKDGTWIIILMRNGQVWRASWGRDRQGELSWCTDKLSLAGCVVTHWIPMPALSSLEGSGVIEK